MKIGTRQTLCVSILQKKKKKNVFLNKFGCFNRNAYKAIVKIELSGGEGETNLQRN